MTPEEREQLLRDVETIKFFSEHTFPDSRGELIEAAERVAVFAREQLAAVGDDEHERATPEWMAQQLGRKLEKGSRAIWLNGTVNIVADTAWCGGEPLCSMEFRFQFRRLCEALGVKLEDG